MKKLRLDLDRLRVVGFDTGGTALADVRADSTRPSACCGTGCTDQPCAMTGLHEDCGHGTVYARGMSYQYDRTVCCGIVEAHGRTLTDWCRYACASRPCNHTTA